MNFVADESVEGQVVATLRREGHSVDYVAEMDPGITDDRVLQMANSRDALLLTVDKDFGELVFRLGRIHPGVILVRLGGIAPEEKARIVARAVEKYSLEIRQAFTVISPGNIRIRAKS